MICELMPPTIRGLCPSHLYHSAQRQRFMTPAHECDLKKRKTKKNPGIEADKYESFLWLGSFHGTWAEWTYQGPSAWTPTSFIGLT